VPSSVNWLAGCGVIVMDRDKLARDVAAEVVKDNPVGLTLYWAYHAALEALNRAVPDGCVVVPVESLKTVIKNSMQVGMQDAYINYDLKSRASIAENELVSMLKAGGE
jgi:hypothetical protein